MRTFAAVATITVVAALARAYGLDWQPLDADEAMHLFPLGFHDTVALDLRNNPPLFRLLVQWITNIERTTWWARGVPFVAGVATVPAAFVLARRHLGAASALTAAAVLACHPWHIRHSQTLRSFTLLTLLLIVSYLLGSLCKNGNKTRHLAGQSASQVAALLTHYLAAPAILLETVTTGRRQGWKRALALVAAPALVLVVLLPVVLAGAEGKIARGSNLAGPGLWSFLRGLPTAFFARGGLSLAFSVSALALGLYHRASRPLILHGLIFIAAVGVAGFFIPVEVRYCLPALPFLIIGACHGAVESMARLRAAGRQRSAAAGVACALVAWGGIVFPLPVYYDLQTQPLIAGYHPDLNRTEEDLDSLAAAITSDSGSAPVTVAVGLGGPQHHRLAVALHRGRYPGEASLSDLSGASVLTHEGHTLINLDRWPPPADAAAGWRRQPPTPGFYVIAPASGGPPDDHCRLLATARGARLLSCPGRLEIVPQAGEGAP